MITLILVGGESQRFKDAGYAKPKCLLPMPDYGTMLDWVVRALPCQHVVIAGRAKHRAELESGVYAAYRYLVGAEHIRMVWSEGQLVPVSASTLSVPMRMSRPGNSLYPPPAVLLAGLPV